MAEKILILDFGSQYTQLIARRVRELEVYSEIQPYHSCPEDFSDIKGVILSGSPFSVKDDDAPKFDVNSIPTNLPVLGICYGAQLMAHNGGGEVLPAKKREYGKAALGEILVENKLFEGISSSSQVWMSHGDSITKLPENATLIAKTEDIPVAAYTINNGRPAEIFAIQFHPEVTHTLEGKKILKNFVRGICQCNEQWTPASFVEQSVNLIKSQVGDEQVVLGLSGGVDSSVAALLMHQAIGKNLHCIFVDNGLLRKDEFEEVLESYKDLGLQITGVNARKEFLDPLSGISDPERKRKIIGKVFIDVFEREAKKLPGVKWLGQGTIYPDVIESISVHGPSVTIKSHHNVGGLPEKLGLKVVEPLRFCFKDEVRLVGAEVNLPLHILNRHPFPGPGLAIRIIGPIDEERVQILQDADAIYIQHLKSSGWYDKVWQAGAILTNMRSVGVMGDERTYEYVLALRAVSSTDGMTAEWSRLPDELLAQISTDIINRVKGVNRVVYDISTKPPATIEWE